MDRQLDIADGEPYLFGDTLCLCGSRDVPAGLVTGTLAWRSDEYHVGRSTELIHWEDCGPSNSIGAVPDRYKASVVPNRLSAPDLCFIQGIGSTTCFPVLSSQTRFGLRRRLVGVSSALDRSSALWPQSDVISACSHVLPTPRVAWPPRSFPCH